MELFLLPSLVLILISCITNTVSGFSQISNRVFVSTPVSNFPKRSVGDCMTPPIDVLTPDMSVDETMKMMLENDLSGAPVVASRKDHTLVGIVTSFDFLQKEAFEGVLLPMEGTAANVEKYVDAAKKICGQRVEDVMSCDPITVSPDDPMRKAAAIMTEKRLHRLPVVDEHGKLLGVVTTANVMKDLLHIVRALLPSEEESTQAHHDDTTLNP